MVYIVILDSLAPRYCHRPYYFLFLYLLKYTFLHPLARMKPRDPTYWYFNNRLLCGISDVQPTWFLEVANNTYLFLIIPVLCHHCYQCPFLYFCVICLLMMISIYVPQSLFSSDCLKILKKKKIRQTHHNYIKVHVFISCHSNGTRPYENLFVFVD